jgi:ATP-dependent DNA helicase RecG|tara:strand:+ start:15788 stop:17884 length:2097 start_codon:yes stop_codon:yes gene_type:complete
MPESRSKRLDTPVQFVKGVGPKRSAVLETEGVTAVRDLIYYFPRRHLDRTTVTPIRNLEKDISATVVGKVEAGGIRTSKRRKYYQMIVNDGTGFLTCTWFNGADYIKKVFSVGDRIAFHGRIDFFKGLQMVHPEYDILSKEESDPLHTGAVIPLYPSTQALKSVGLDGRGFRRIISSALDFLEDNREEFFDEELRKGYDLIQLDEALRFIHFAPDSDRLSQATRRLKFDEHFFLQLLMALRKTGITESKGRVMSKVGPYLKLLYDQLDFELTQAQKRVLKEIRQDMGSSKVMNRLLQGDVGAGKTIVAILAAAIAVGNGAQVAIMAPTEILAYQHYGVLASYLTKTQITTALLVGKQKSSERKKILEGIADGRVQVVVGTHALIQEDVRFKDLGFVVIDEQQRFGVLQRGKLLEKGFNPDVLIMTATPIPRTLAITYHGDMDLSLLDEMPKDRKPPVTRKVNEDTLKKVYSFMSDQVEKGRQCIVVYPLIEESKKSDLEAAEAGFKTLSSKIFPNLKLALLHGRMQKEEKDGIMDGFGANEIQILVSTTVVEVGIDVPNATVMLIENAERFGLTQLHQLRGRIGRGSEKGYCILVQRKITATSRLRLDVILRTNDGFEISDEDLKLRGPGEFYGTKQHGYLKWKIADLVKDGSIIREARKAAFNVVEEDPHLRLNGHEQIRKRFMRDYQHMIHMVNIS